MPSRKKPAPRPYRKPVRRPQRSAPPIALWIGVGGIVVVAFILGMTMKGGSSETDPLPIVDATKKRQEPKKPAAVQKAEEWYRATFLDSMGWQRPLAADEIRKGIKAGDARGFEKVAGFEWAQKRQKLYALLLKKAPGDADAHRAHGRVPVTDYPDFWKVYRRLLGARTLPKKLERFRNEWEGKISLNKTLEGKYRIHLIPLEKYDAFKGALSDFVAYEQKLAGDPQLEAILNNLQRIKRDPILGLYETVHIVVHPFVVFYASEDLILPRNPTEADHARVETKREEMLRRLKRREPFLRAYLEFFRKHWMKTLALPEFDKTDLLFVWAFDTLKSFKRYQVRSGRQLPPGVLGFFNDRERFSFVYEDPKEPGMVLRTLAHELTHHLHWFFCKDPGGRFKNHFRRIKSVWLEEGWAEYVGAVVPFEQGWEFGGVLQSRVEMLHICRNMKLPLVPLRDLVRREDYAEWIAWVQLWLAKTLPDLKEVPEELREISKLFQVMAYFEILYAESWLFVKFLYEYESGKYKKAIRAFTKASTRGYAGYVGARGYPRAHEVLEQLLGIKARADWEPIQKEFDEYLEATLYAHPPKK